MATSSELARELARFLPAERIYADPVRRLAYSVDASMYQRRSLVVVDVHTEEEVRELLAYATQKGVGVTFRGSGTSLNGQACGEGILARLRGEAWKHVTVLDGGERVRAGCGVLGSDVNAQLAPLKKMGPDPASLASATMGGIVVNNAAGMCCTVDQNTFASLDAIRLILADGTLLDTADPASVSRLRTTHAPLLASLAALRAEIFERPEEVERIRRKYRIKNTCGYALNAFTEHEDPVDVLTHLMVGSEGTLGFVSSATLRTIDILPHRATALIFFADLKTGAQAVTRWKKLNLAEAAEVFDGPTLRALSKLAISPPTFKELDLNACAVLLETRSRDPETLARNAAQLTEAIADIPTLTPVEFYFDEKRCAWLWAVRQALFAAVAGARRPDETVVIEDVCFPVEHLEEGCLEFGKLFARHGYMEGGVQGHAFHGNLHFCMPVDLTSDAERERVHAFLEDMMHMVLGLDGSLKAEHGTGYTVAPFVRLEWGDFLYDVMRRVKAILDPHGILNPGTLLNDDPKCHTKDLKVPLASHDKLDNCVECGFCEPICPSGRIAFSPRQRVAMWREVARLRAKDALGEAAEWEKAFDELGTDLCATDGLCLTRCPLRVDVAGFVRDRRADRATDGQKRLARSVGNHFAGGTRSMSLLLDGLAFFQRLLGDAVLAGGAGVARKVSGGRLPAWNASMPRGAGRVRAPQGPQGGDRVVYVPSCAARTMGDTVHDPGDDLPTVTIRVLERAGYTVVIPANIDKLCCGKAFETKGLFEEADAMSREMEAALLTASENGALPILCDTSPCLARMRKVMDERLKMYEPVEFALAFLTDRLTLHRLPRRVAVHPTCSMRLLGLAEPFVELAGRCAEEVVWPKDIQCCGFSGDKGFTHPELNAAALATLRGQVADCDAGYSTSRTCEIGLSLHGGISYKNVMYLLDESSTPR